MVDFGCGFGRVLLAALATGFRGSTGWEFVENESQRVAFESTKAKLHAYSDATWIGEDILTLEPTLELCGQVTSAYAFWVGFPKPVQLRILEIADQSLPTSVLLLFFWIVNGRSQNEVIGTQSCFYDYLPD